MSFFQRLRNALSRFMYGRNGADQLGLCIIWVAILLDVISMLTKNTAVSGVVGMITTVLVLWALFRVFSRNLEKRRADERRLFAEGLVAHQAPVQQRTAAADGQGAQVLHLPQLQDRVPRAGREGEDRHYLPQMRPGDTRKKLISYYRKTSAPTFVGALGFFASQSSRPQACTWRKILFGLPCQRRAVAESLIGRKVARLFASEL